MANTQANSWRYQLEDKEAFEMVGKATA